MMNDGKYKSMPAETELRLRAEELLQVKESERGLSRSDEETQRLLHELQVHRIELEMQNTELRQVRDEMEKSLEKYTDLYDFAPVGYFTLNRNGEITAANLSGVSLLGSERSQLIGRRFGLWVIDEFSNVFTTFLDTVYSSFGKVVCEVALLKKGADPLFVQIEAMDNSSGQECRLVLIDVSERKRAEADLRGYASRLIEMEEDLRKKLATELHDEIGSDLTVLGMNLAVIGKSMTDDAPQKLVSMVSDASGLAGGISRSVRGIMAMLRPPVLDDYGLLAALHWHADLFTKRTGIAVTVLADATLPRLILEKEMALFRIAQEALMNASKYASVPEITIRISSEKGMLRYMIIDKGKGFDPASFKDIQAGSGWGLNIMRERAESIGGKLHFYSEPGKGTEVTVFLPLEGV